tara:strand:+ start:1349 stop:2200 length:852 start_codon:yes stop_codon:yes gene_type:complete
MSRISYVNGVYSEHKDSYVHIEDRGYQFADGVYEVFGILDRNILDYEGHIYRLYKSLKEIGLESPINKSAYKFHIKRLILKNKIKNGLIYLQITRGVAERDFKFPKNVKPSLVIIAKNLPDNEYNDNFKRGISVKTTKDLRWKRVDIKTINLLAPVLAKQKAYEDNCQEAWLVDEDGFITEGSSSTAWILKKSTLYTTPLSSSILNGITRQSLIAGLKKNKLKLIEKKFNIKDIRESDEAFITSATQFVMPVIKVNNFNIGDGKVGKYADIFRKAYMEAVKFS